MRKWSRIVLLVLCQSVCSPVDGSTHISNLPTLDLGDFPNEVRSQVQQAYDSAREHSGDAEASGKLGMLLDLYNRPEGAAACYQRAHDLDPGTFKWLYYRGMLLAKQKKSAEAVESLREALRLDPTYLPVRLRLAENLLAAGKMDDSRQIYSGILIEFPDSAEAHYGLGRISVFQGKLTAARQSLRRACELFPRYGAAHYALAQVDQKLGENADAEEQIKLYEQNKNVVPPVEDPLRDALRALDRGAASHLERGLALDQVGRLDDALAETERAAELDPTMLKAHINLIILYGRKGDFQKAEEHFQTAVRLNPNQFPDAYYNYGVLLVREGKLDGAEKAFRQVLEISPSYADAHNNLGNLLERQGKLQEAIAEYKEAIESKPDFRQAHFNLGRILVNQQQYPEGIRHLQQTLTPVDESTPAYLYALGAAYGRAGDHQNALRYLRQARDEASGRGQAQLLTSIEKDLQGLEAAKGTH